MFIAFHLNHKIHCTHSNMMQLISEHTMGWVKNLKPDMVSTKIEIFSAFDISLLRPTRCTLSSVITYSCSHMSGSTFSTAIFATTYRCTLIILTGEYNRYEFKKEILLEPRILGKELPSDLPCSQTSHTLNTSIWVKFAWFMVTSYTWHKAQDAWVRASKIFAELNTTVHFLQHI